MNELVLESLRKGPYKLSYGKRDSLYTLHPLNTSESLIERYKGIYSNITH